jgi:hypothetical protein
LSDQSTRHAAAPGPRRPARVERTGYVELAALPLTPYWARRHAQAVLGAWQVPPETIEIATLLVSELTTNAVAATTANAAAADDPAAAGLIIQTLRRQPGRIVIEVSDSDPRPPVITDAGTDAESGRRQRPGQHHERSITMTDILGHADSMLPPEQQRRPGATRAAAEQLLTSTADMVNPATSAPDLLACLTRYRAHLSALVAATKPATTQDGTPPR